MALAWFTQAEEDLKAAEITFNENIYNVSVYLSEQAVEKFLKGYLINAGKKIELVHDLEKLGNLIKKETSLDTGPIMDKLKDLNKHYSESRYPIVLTNEQIEALGELINYLLNAFLSVLNTMILEPLGYKNGFRKVELDQNQMGQLVMSVLVPALLYDKETAEKILGDAKEVIDWFKNQPNIINK